MKKDKLKITAKERAKGDDGYKTFSIRIKEETVEQLETIANKTDRSRNEIINILIEYAISNCEIETK